MHLYKLVFPFSLWLPWSRNCLPDFSYLRTQPGARHKVDAGKLFIKLSLHKICEQCYSHCYLRKWMTDFSFHLIVRDQNCLSVCFYCIFWFSSVLFAGVISLAGSIQAYILLISPSFSRSPNGQFSFFYNPPKLGYVAKGVSNSSEVNPMYTRVTDFMTICRANG